MIISGITPSIRRFPAIAAPAAVVVAAGGTVEMMQPQTANIICSAGVSRHDAFAALVYDRGCIVSNGVLLRTPFTAGAERPLMLLENQTLYEMRTMDTGFALARSLDVKDELMATAYLRERRAFALCALSPTGDLCVFDFEDFRMLTCVSLGDQRARFAFFHIASESLLLICVDRLVQFVFDGCSIIYTEPMVALALADFDDGLLIVASAEGHIYIRRVTDGKLMEVVTTKSMERVICVAAQYGVFAYVGEKNMLRFGRTLAEAVLIELPFQVYAIGFFGPGMDLLVTLDAEIMVLRRDAAYHWFPTAEPLSIDSDDPVDEAFCHPQVAKNALLKRRV
jgi:hypothetical protein